MQWRDLGSLPLSQWEMTRLVKEARLQELFAPHRRQLVQTLHCIVQAQPLAQLFVGI